MGVLPYFLYAFPTLSIAMQFFMTEPLACEPSDLPKYPPSKEMDARRRDDEARRYECLDFYFCFCSIYVWFLLFFCELALLMLFGDFVEHDSAD